MNHATVKSSNVSSVGYDADSKTLEVNFKNGSTYHYQDVTPSDHLDLMRAPSVGKHLSANIVGKFTHRKVR